MQLEALWSRQDIATAQRSRATYYLVIPQGCLRHGSAASWKIPITRNDVNMSRVTCRVRSKAQLQSFGLQPLQYLCFEPEVMFQLLIAPVILIALATPRRWRHPRAKRRGPSAGVCSPPPGAAATAATPPRASRATRRCTTTWCGVNGGSGLMRVCVHRIICVSFVIYALGYLITVATVPKGGPSKARIPGAEETMTSSEATALISQQPYRYQYVLLVPKPFYLSFSIPRRYTTTC